ncbi:hypothetical protein EDB81DRAFT_768295 [Dactylonectria macrodidyma]|uniref:Uncharacterized protein n=1 Tax=Dactylonectria macrodidyma TaxID=307937 RepID=A0A9P9D5F4_9HYPO|nr:hypothetical protein EDB81DRAFT_768295 [Dactylonectria macrodidyma]
MVPAPQSLLPIQALVASFVPKGYSAQGSRQLAHHAQLPTSNFQLPPGGRAPSPASIRLPSTKHLPRYPMAQPRSVEELEKLLRQAEQRADKAERERQEERQRADQAEEQTRPTTLDEYIAACHDLVFSKFVVETDKKLTSKGSITNPRNKWCPTHLRPWSDFLEQQRVIFGALYDTFPAQSRAFESRSFLAGLGNRISQRSIGNEKTLENFLHNSVEDPVRAIIEQLKQVEEVSSTFDMGNGIIFENHPHAISDVAEEVVDRETPSTPPQTPDHTRDLNQLRPDQICVYRSNDVLATTRTMIYVSEYKPPHKLTAPHLRLGLRAMNIPKDVVNRKTMPTSVDPDALFQYHAERLTASAVTQTYHYMIEVSSTASGNHHVLATALSPAPVGIVMGLALGD